MAVPVANVQTMVSVAQPKRTHACGSRFEAQLLHADGDHGLAFGGREAMQTHPRRGYSALSVVVAFIGHNSGEVFFLYQVKGAGAKAGPSAHIAREALVPQIANARNEGSVHPAAQQAGRPMRMCDVTQCEQNDVALNDYISRQSCGGVLT